MLKVSIGLPFYNDEKTLRYTIQSILLQSYTDWELILLDDGSTDGSLAIAKSIKDKRVRVVSDNENKGLAVRLNEIANLANGQYLARMDADDLMHPDRIKEQVLFLEENPEIDVVGTNAYSIDLNEKLLGIRKSTVIPTEEYIVFKNSIFVHPTIMGSTEWFRRNPYNENKEFCRAEDYELWCRTIKTSKFFILNRPLLFYREANSIVKNIDNYLKTFSSILNVIRKYGIKNIGYKKGLFLYLMVYIKIIVYYVLWKTDRLNLLIKKRYERLTPGEQEKIQKVICKIKVNSDEEQTTNE